MRYLKLKALILTAVLFATTPIVAYADNTELQGTLAAAKFTGACGVVNSLILFQDSTQMPEGDKFLERFLAVEMARLGLTAQEYADQCAAAIQHYNILWNALETDAAR